MLVRLKKYKLHINTGLFNLWRYIYNIHLTTYEMYIMSN